jgi:hypothetical protein
MFSMVKVLPLADFAEEFFDYRATDTPLWTMATRSGLKRRLERSIA